MGGTNVLLTFVQVTQLLLYGKTPKRTFDAFALTSRVFKIGIKSKTVLGNSIRCYGCSVKSKHANELKHQTQALMGTTRPAGKDSAII